MERPWIILFFIVFLAAGVLAGFSYEGHSIQENYVEGEIVKGIVNVSFDSEPVDSLLGSNHVGNISLIDFFRNSSFVLGVDYNCSTPGCSEDYTVQESVSGVNIQSSKTLGLRVEGSDITSIESLSFRIRGDNPGTCVTPAVVDFLNSGKIIVNDKYENEACGTADYGCFSNGNSEVTLTTTAYCNKITLPRGPAYRLGAKVKNSTNGNGAELKMELYSLDGDFIDDCILPRHTSQNQDLECVLERSLPVQDDYLVCIKRGALDGIREPNYKIRSETQDACGTDDLGLTFTRDYEIFSKVLKSDTADLTVNDALFQDLYNEDLTDFVYDYLLDEYQGSCNPYCVIPIEFSGSADNLDFSNIDFSYKSGNTLVNDDNIYTLEVEDAEISSGILELDLEDMRFIVEDKAKFRFYIGGDEVFNERINVSKGLDFKITPGFVAFGQETLFRITGVSNITKSEWDFGDGEEESVLGGSVSHSYLEEGEFEVRVTVTAGSVGSKVFKVLVGDAKTSAGLTIDKYKDRLATLKDLFEKYPVWLNKVIEEKVDLVIIESSLESLEKRYESAEGEENYTEIMLDLLELDVPISVNASRSGSLPLAIGFENFDVSYIEEISGRQAEGLRDAIGSWMTNNYEGDIEFEVLSGQYDSGSEAILTRVKLDLVPATNSGVSYLVIDYELEDARFSANYGAKAVNGGMYIPLRGDRRVIEFAVLEEISPEELGIYISPDISQLNLDSREIIDDSGGFNWILFIIGMIVLLTFAFIVYIVMQEWYKRNYEAHLFRSDNDLYNLINFIYNSRRSGMNDSQIKHKLKKSKWSSEQINYAIKKLDGKRTGMFEIPIFKRREKRKVRQEIMKRQVSTGER